MLHCLSDSRQLRSRQKKREARISPHLSLIFKPPELSPDDLQIVFQTLDHHIFDELHKNRVIP